MVESGTGGNITKYLDIIIGGDTVTFYLYEYDGQ